MSFENHEARGYMHDLDALVVVLPYSRGACSQSGPHWQSIRCGNFDEAGIESRSRWNR